MLNRISKILFVSLGSALANVSNATPGIRNSLDIAVISQAKDIYFDKIVSLVNSITLPDLEDGKGNYMRENTFTLNQRADEVQFFTDVENNAVVMRCDKLSAKFRSNAFRYKETIFVAKGYAEVDINQIDIQFGIKFDLNTLPDGRMVPSISGVDIENHINRFDINIKLGGNLITDFASLFEVFFVGTVADLIEETINLTLNTGIPLVADTVLNYTDGYFPVPLVPDWVVDWETNEAAVITSSAFQIGVKGLMFDKAYGEEEPAVEIPDLPYHMSNHIEKYQAYVSSYSIDGFFNSLLEVFDI